MTEPQLTRHVRLRMMERGISEADVRSALARQHGDPVATATGKMWVFGYSTKGRILKVLLTTDESTIVTAAWPDE